MVRSFSSENIKSKAYIFRCGKECLSHRNALSRFFKIFNTSFAKTLECSYDTKPISVYIFFMSLGSFWSSDN